MALDDVLAHDRGVVHRDDPGLGEVARALGALVWKERPLPRARAEGGGAAVDEVRAADVEERRVELSGEQHRADALLLRDVGEVDPRRGPEARHSTVAALGETLHV